MGGRFELKVTDTFSSAHRLRGYEGNCERIHGHNWKVEVVVTCPVLDSRGLGIDFRDLKSALREVLEKLDHKNLNDIEPFNTVNPSSENLALYISTQVEKRVPDSITLLKVSVWESESACASYVLDG